MSKTFDPESYNLACYFLNDYETRSKKVSQADRDDLAWTIQQAIENWMEEQDTEADAKAEAAREESFL